MRKTGPLLIVAGGLLLLGSPLLRGVPATSPEAPAPSAAVQAIVKPLGALLTGHPAEARELAGFYQAAADAVRRDAAGRKILGTTEDLRTFLERAVAIRFQGAFQKLPGLSAAIHGPDGALAKLLGREVKDLGHAGAADALEAVAWACRAGAGG